MWPQGVGFAAVEIDCLTGEIQILRTDLHMDLGSSLNPAIDIGQVRHSSERLRKVIRLTSGVLSFCQVEGGLIMALGYLFTEEVLYGAKDDPSARPRKHCADQIQVNLGTWNYKPPSAFDIPQVCSHRHITASP